MDYLIPTVVSAGYAAGLNAYGTVLLLGLLGRAGVGDAVPEQLMTDNVLIGAGIMYAIEFVTDKVPLLDNTWDLLHTLIRPAIGSAIGIEFADLDQAVGATEVAAGAGGGGTALVSHAIKSGTRLGINLSPEPASNIIASLTEDGIVAFVVFVALEQPLVALAIVLTLIAIGIGVLFLLRKAIKGALENRRRRKGALIEEERGPPDPPEPPKPPG